jgi:hypothetical protein
MLGGVNEMDKSYLLIQQMTNLEQICKRFYSALQRAQAEGAPSDLLADAARLMAQLRGGPDAGGIQAMRDADRDVTATQAFCDRWQSHRSDSTCAAFLEVAEQTLALLLEFRDTVNSLSRSERAEFEASARMGRALMGKGCLLSILLFTIAAASVVTIVACL